MVMSQINESTSSTLEVPASDATTAMAATSTLAEGDVPTMEAIKSNLKGSHRPRSRSRTDSFQRWQKQQAQEIKASNSCHLLIMNLHHGTHVLARECIEAMAGPAVMAVRLLPTKTFGFATMASSMLAEEFAAKLHGVQLSNGVMLAVERCKAVTPERNPRVYDASTPVSTHVAVKNLPYSCTDDSIRALLKACGIAQPVTMELKLNAHNLFNGTAFLEFESEAVAEQACHLISAIALDSRVLRAEFKRPSGTNIPKVYRPPDDECRQLYDQLIAFKESPKPVVVYPSTIGPAQRKQLHLMAESLNLKHVSEGDSEDRTLRIWKGHKSMSPNPHRRSSLGSAMEGRPRCSSADKATIAALRTPRSRSLGARTAASASRARVEVRAQMLASSTNTEPRSRKSNCIVREPKGPDGNGFISRRIRHVTDV
eukprot:m.40499 g.40499  ORF g.40499 m.40499 type:complete len:427 (-) comp12751_c0_seq1:49-1329(-)